MGHTEAGQSRTRTGASRHLAGALPCVPPRISVVFMAPPGARCFLGHAQVSLGHTVLGSRVPGFAVPGRLP